MKDTGYLFIKMEKTQKSNAAEKPVEKAAEPEKYEERLVRILSEDIEGKMALYAGLTKIKGVSWGIANAVCKALNLDKNRKIGSLSQEEIKKISEFIKNPKIPGYLLNRRKDFETGENTHVSGTDLELQKEFDIKRLKKIKSYRGVRHAAGLPTRGQRTKGHFRKNKTKGAGIKSKKKEKGGRPERQFK